MRSRLRAAMIGGFLLILPAGGAAQLPGLPVLQNAFVNPGVSVAIDFGSGGGSGVFAGALSYGTRRSGVSAGIGVFTPDSGSSGIAVGARGSLQLTQFARRTMALGVFAGVGASSGGEISLVHLPVGIGIGWRRGFGGGRGVSVHVAPMFAYQRASDDSVTTSRGLVRGSLGLDLAISRRLGISLGGEVGTMASSEDPGPRGNTGGIAIGWAFGRR